MPQYRNDMTKPTEEEKMNNHLKSLLNQYKKTMDSDGKNVLGQNPHNTPHNTGSGEGPMRGPLMTWTTMLEAMDDVINSIEIGPPDTTGIEDGEIEPTSLPAPDMSGQTTDDKDLMDELNKIFTPILVMQGFENEMKPGKITESIEKAGVLTEQNVIQFDDATRMAQLISTCALLIQRKKNTEKWQMYAKAAAIRNQMKLDMQKEEYEAAKALAQKYLVMVSTTNSSPIARDAATSLLPQTQH